VPTSLAVAGIDRSTWDFVFTLPRRRAQVALAPLGLPSGGVHRLRRREQIVEAIDVLRPLSRLLTRAPGGPVSNTLAAMAILAGGVRPHPGSARPGLELHWTGPVGRVGEHPREPVGSPLDSLRSLSVTTRAAEVQPTHDATLCLVDEASRETFLILVEENPRSSWRPKLPDPCDVVIVTLRDLLSRSSPDHAAGRRLALIVGDGIRLDDTGRAALGARAANDAIGWVFGRCDELGALGLLPGDGGHVALPGAEVVATDGARPVLVFTPDAVRPRMLDVPVVAEVRGNDLGAGDAYAGGYLFGRLMGESVDGAHRFGLRASGRVLESDRARPLRCVGRDLADTIGARTQRSGANDDLGGLFERVRVTNGLTVVCGGQTGVDQLGLAAAADLGLAAFCVLPYGRRTEVTEGLADGPDVLRGARLEILDSPSYRYRTWVTAYLADGTLLWDFHDSEGSLAAKNACAAFGRPLLDLTKIEPRDRVEAARAWARLYDIRVANIAGNRGSFLDADQRALVQRECFTVLRALAYDRADGSSRAPTISAPRRHSAAGRGPSRPLRIGVSSATAQRRLFAQFMAEAYGADIPSSPVLTATVERPALDIVFARAHDMPAFLREGAIDLVICGSDVMHGLTDEVAIALDTGLFPLLVVLVGRSGTDLSDDPPPGGRRLGCQYGRRFADTLTTLPVPKEIQSIGGGAEAWLRLGLLDLAVDTWKTGNTAAANDVALLEVLLGTSLAAARPRQAAETEDAALSEFVDTFGDWLAGVIPGEVQRLT
jgi:ATP phosphoribosyltransferase/sugar/nucleoside kinase (ribokinase family)